MRTSLNEIEQTEKYLFNQLNAKESLVFEAAMITNPVLKFNVRLQEKIYFLVKLYHRKKLKEKMEIVHQKIFTDAARKDFQQSIYQLFHS